MKTRCAVMVIFFALATLTPMVQAGHTSDTLLHVSFDTPTSQTTNPSSDFFYTTDESQVADDFSGVHGSCSQCGLSPNFYGVNFDTGESVFFNLNDSYQGQYTSVEMVLSPQGLSTTNQGGDTIGKRQFLLSDVGNLGWVEREPNGLGVNQGPGFGDFDIRDQNSNLLLFIDGCALPSKITWDVDWSAEQITTSVGPVSGGTCGSTTYSFNSSLRTKITGLEIQDAEVTNLADFYDDFIFDGLGVIPSAPDGLEGEIVRAPATSSTSGRVDLAWNPSAEDQRVGLVEYDIYRNGSFLQTAGTATSATLYYVSADNLSLETYTIRARAFGTSGDSCSISLNHTIDLDADECGGTVVKDVQGSEFSTGLVDTVAQFGFVSKESQMLFSMILIGVATVATGVGTRLLSPSPWKNWSLVGVGVGIAAMCVIIGLLDLWAAIVATMLGVFAVKGSGEARNTFHELKERIRMRAEGQVSNEMEIVTEGPQRSEFDPVEFVEPEDGAED